MTVERVYVTRKLPDQVLRSLKLDQIEICTPEAGVPDSEELRTQAAASDAFVVTISERLDADFFAALDRTGRLRVVSSMSTGVDHIDQEAARDAGIEVLRLPSSVTGPATAELTWALVLAIARGIVPAANALHDGEWSGWDPWQWTGLQLEGSTLGVIGFGAVGVRVTQYATAFGMKVLCATRTIPTLAEHADVEFVDLAELAMRSDVITVHVPLTPSTKDLVNSAFLTHVRPGTVLVNTSRGGVVDEQAVLEALNDRRLEAVGLDVYTIEPVAPDNPLVLHPRVLTLPHIGSATKVTRLKMAVSAVQAAIDALGRPG